MSLDLLSLHHFYTTPLGRMVQNTLVRTMQSLWEADFQSTSHHRGLCLAIGYPIPFWETLNQTFLPCLTLMPARQGVMRWPRQGLNQTVLTHLSTLPFPDNSVDRVILVHALEHSEDASETLAEVWRILAPNGRLLLIVPNRHGLWARAETTPFGYGAPFSRGQLTQKLNATLFSIEQWREILFIPPINNTTWLKLAPTWEKVGSLLHLPLAGVHAVDAAKHVLRPLKTVRARRRFVLNDLPIASPLPAPQPAFHSQVHGLSVHIPICHENPKIKSHTQ
jgi:SAM-dependent methyltransferase